MPRELPWAYGVITVPSRRDTLLPRTLASLESAGFDCPRLFVDGARNDEARWWETTYGLEVTCRHPKVRLFGNWALALGELFVRKPEAERFAVFQDDFITYKNLRKYLDSIPYPSHGYLNLYTFPDNQRLAPRIGQTKRRGEGFYRSNQRGHGALALVFDRQAVLALMTHRNFVERPVDPVRGWRLIDGGVLWAMKAAGYTEYVHNPSLTQHIGTTSTFDKGERSTGKEAHFIPYQWSKSHEALTFRGEDFDALELLKSDSRITS